MKSNSKKSPPNKNLKKVLNKKHKVSTLSQTKNIISSPLKSAKKEKKLVKNLKKIHNLSKKKINIKKKVSSPKRANTPRKIVSPKKATSVSKATPKRGGIAKKEIPTISNISPVINVSRSPVRGRGIMGKVAIPSKLAKRTSPNREVVIPEKVTTRASPKKELAIIIDNSPKLRKKRVQKISKSKSNTPTKIVSISSPKKDKVTPKKTKIVPPKEVIHTDKISPFTSKTKSPINIRIKSKPKIAKSPVNLSPVKAVPIIRSTRNVKAVDVEMTTSRSPVKETRTSRGLKTNFEMSASRSPVKVARATRSGKLVDVNILSSRSPTRVQKETLPKQMSVSNSPVRIHKKTPPKQKQVKRKASPFLQKSPLVSRSPNASPRKNEKVKKQKAVSRTPEKKVSKAQMKQLEKPEEKIIEMPKTLVKDEKIKDQIKELEKQLQKLKEKSANKETKKVDNKNREVENVKKMPSLSPKKELVKNIKKKSPIKQIQRSPSPAKVSPNKQKVTSNVAKKNVQPAKEIITPSSVIPAKLSKKSQEKQIIETPRSVAKSTSKQREKFETPTGNVALPKSSVQSAKNKNFETPAAVQQPIKQTHSREKTQTPLIQELRPSSIRSQKRSPENKITVHKDFKDIVTNIEMINKKKEEEEKPLPKNISKPRITVVEKSVPPKKIAAQSTTYKQQSPKISEDKNLFDKNFKKYIDLTDINKKKHKITSLEILLSIVEVAQHGQHYNIENSNRSVQFWKKVSEMKFCENIFNCYRPETIRKYWRFINERQVEKVIAVINRIKTFKEDYNVK